MTKTLRFILGDQLSRSISSLKGLDKADDVVVMAEVNREATFVRYHKKKLGFLYSAMRHFAEALRHEGIRVQYFPLDQHDGPGTLGEALRRAVGEWRPSQVVITEPGAWRVLDEMQDWAEALACPVLIRADDRFFCSREEFTRWAQPHRGGLRMEYFYREMRRKTGLLMAGSEPEGGSWNFDAENRKPLPRRIEVPLRPSFARDQTTSEVLALVGQHFGNHFGDLEPFDYPVTRAEALDYLKWFIANGLAEFGTYQDAMRQGEPLLFHSHLSALINCGLLLPKEVCAAAAKAYAAGKAPLHSVEGFIRQILGWREFIRGVYWLQMPGYGELNALAATHDLPSMFWGAETGMNCMAQAIGETKRNAYAHHIQRLMVIGNFALLAGLDPAEVQEWYLIVYHDAYEWVEMPNVVGMILHADGGLFASKPYAASGAYINRMSDYCRRCAYDVKQRTGDRACPLNFLYWDFLDRHRERFAANPRMRMMYKNLDKLPEPEVQAIRQQARAYLKALE